MHSQAHAAGSKDKPVLQTLTYEFLKATLTHYDDLRLKASSVLAMFAAFRADDVGIADIRKVKKSEDAATDVLSVDAQYQLALTILQHESKFKAEEPAAKCFLQIKTNGFGEILFKSINELHQEKLLNQSTFLLLCQAESSLKEASDLVIAKKKILETFANLEKFSDAKFQNIITRRQQVNQFKQEELKANQHEFNRVHQEAKELNSCIKRELKILINRKPENVVELHDILENLSTRKSLHFEHLAILKLYPDHYKYVLKRLNNINIKDPIPAQLLTHFVTHPNEPIVELKKEIKVKTSVVVKPEPAEDKTVEALPTPLPPSLATNAQLKLKMNAVAKQQPKQAPQLESPGEPVRAERVHETSEAKTPAQGLGWRDLTLAARVIVATPLVMFAEAILPPPTAEFPETSRRVVPIIDLTEHCGVRLV